MDFITRLMRENCHIICIIGDVCLPIYPVCIGIQPILNIIMSNARSTLVCPTPIHLGICSQIVRKIFYFGTRGCRIHRLPIWVGFTIACVHQFTTTIRHTPTKKLSRNPVPNSTIINPSCPRECYRFAIRSPAACPSII